MAGRLSQDQVQFFNNEGYLLYNEPVFSPEKFGKLQAHFERLLASWTGMGYSAESLDTPHFYDTDLFDYLFDDRVLDMVESLIGPDIALWSSHFICKPAGVGKRVPWHEDSAYWKGRLDPMDVLTAWLAVDPSTPDNGCMRVVPRTHHEGFSDYDFVADPHNQVFQTEIKGHERFERQAVDCTLKPNECSIHHAKCVHGSHANTGQMRRCGYTMRYMPATVKFVDDVDQNGFQIYLARGKDRAGNRYGDPGKPNPNWQRPALARG